jgi:hypothetical protein
VNTVLSMPSNPKDARFRAPRSKDCPNDISQEEAAPSVPAPKAGLCGFCAWGFYSMESSGQQQGEDPKGLGLVAVLRDGKQAGYKAQCGKVALYQDASGRVGALRKASDENRFFPGIKGNWAYERYVARNPELLGAVEGHA